MSYVGTIKRWIGDSNETKPYPGMVDYARGNVLAASDIPGGSTFYEEDTGRMYVFEGERWEPDRDTAQATRIITALGAKLDSLLEESKVQTPLLRALTEDFPEEVRENNPFA